MMCKNGGGEFVLEEKGSCSANFLTPKIEDDVDEMDEDDDVDVEFITKDEALKGKLVALTSDSGDIVAYGRIISLNDASLPNDCMRVAIDRAVILDSLLPFPNSNSCQSIVDAVASHVAWPADLIKMQDDENHGRKKHGHEQDNLDLESSTVPKSLWIVYCYFKHALKYGRILEVILDSGVFGTPHTLKVQGEVDLVPFCKLQPISVTCISVYIWA